MNSVAKLEQWPEAEAKQLRGHLLALKKEQPHLENAQRQLKGIFELLDKLNAS